LGENLKVISSIYALLSITFWGISFVSTKAVLRERDPFTLVSLRFGIASVFLLLLPILLKDKVIIPLRSFPHIFILAILGIFVHQLIQATALLSIEASAAGWIISFSPIFTAVLSVLFLREHFTFWKAIGITIAAVGVLLVTAQGNGGKLQFTPTIGYLLMILSTLNWAVYSILIKKFCLPYSSLTITFCTSLTGFLMTIPFMFRNNGLSELTHLSVQSWVHLLFLGVFVSAIAYWYWGKALHVLDATQVSVLLYLEPLATLVAAVLLLQEHIVLTTIFGGVFIIIGVSTVNHQFIQWIKRWAMHFRK
jgi:drug/metabolite transporter (DMT)-like permease